MDSDTCRCVTLQLESTNRMVKQVEKYPRTLADMKADNEGFMSLAGCDSEGSGERAATTHWMRQLPRRTGSDGAVGGLKINSKSRVGCRGNRMGKKKSRESG